MQCQVLAQVSVQVLAQVSSEIKVPVQVKKEKPDSKNYLDLKNQICKDTFHIGC